MDPKKFNRNNHDYQAHEVSDPLKLEFDVALLKYICN